MALVVINSTVRHECQPVQGCSWVVPQPHPQPEDGVVEADVVALVGVLARVYHHDSSGNILGVYS